ncbi:MAG: alanine--tRNA ligase [Patescibacteria group bacterium]|nr:alanine--tRNA ligase [Patescibacteria group bacterium]
MTSSDIRSSYIDFFVQRNHKEIPSAPLIPENDPTTLFTSSGMQPLVPYLLGQPHPLGKRLVNSQKSIRFQDIDEVGDNRHTTFFEMLGNWSLGDYFKKEQLFWIFTFLTEELSLDPRRLYVTVFEGNDTVPKDTESVHLWKEIFSSVRIDAKEGERIFAYPAKKNWWSRAGEPEHMPPGEPGGPDSEIFFDFGEDLRLHERSPWKSQLCHPNCDCGRFMEIGNSVFMQYRKCDDGSLQELRQKNVDFGGGLERIAASINDNPDVFTIDLFVPIITILSDMTKTQYGNDGETTRSMRIIADHVRAAVFLISDRVIPSNKQQGYVLRRLIRRILMHGRKLGISEKGYLRHLVDPIVDAYKEAYPTVCSEKQTMYHVFEEESNRFMKSLDKGMREIEKISMLDGKVAFYLYESYGFPWEMTAEIAIERGQTIDRQQFEEEFKKHQDISRTAAAGMFAGGLEDHSQETIRLHTAHHLFLAALQKIVDSSIRQRGSNITAERLRIDVSLSRGLTQEEKEKVEALVNEKIQEGLPVIRVDMDKKDAEKIGAQMEFGKKYPDRVSVYFIGSQDNFFSAEFCGGPHVSNTKELGEGGKRFKIFKEESIGTGMRRFKAGLIN